VTKIIENRTDDFLEACLPGKDLHIIRIKDQISRLNHQREECRSILLLGETGVGKTRIASIIAMHRCWIGKSFLQKEERRLQKALSEMRSFYVKALGGNILEDCGRPFREISLPSLEGDLARSQLFGHTKGSFTGAQDDRDGFLSLKNVSDILLDEIGYAGKAMQRDLLQVLQSGSFYKIGDTNPQQTDKRLIFATNQDLQELSRKGDFQEDLLWRIVDQVIEIPPLRKRKSEIRLICAYFENKFNKEIFDDKTGESNIYLSEADLQWAESYEWRGNFREIEKSIKRWFFYRNQKRLEEVCDEVKKYIPVSSPDSKNIFLQLNKHKIEEYFLEKIQEALIGQKKMSSPGMEVSSILKDAKRKIEGILSASITKSGNTSLENLDNIFEKSKGLSARAWISKKKIREKA
jgi:transcriptional regulator with GAF, ATPase, and Fis domain